MSAVEPLTVLADLGALPTAPLHEATVAGYVARFLRERGLPFQVDPYGNLIATYRNADSPRPIALVAHLDHPALELTAVASDGTATASLLGGVPAACFARPVPVLVVGETAAQPATIVGVEIDPATGRVASLTLRAPRTAQVGQFAVFDLPGFRQDGDAVAMRAADDLAGVAVALQTLDRVARRGLPGVVYGVFTRAEEIGLIGAQLVAQAGLLPRETIVVSLECSRELPGAEIGQGPVIRVGDRTSAFHPEGEALLLAARDRLAGAPIQRQLMSGGTCEATAFGRAGYRTTGVALPLRNYHNVGPDGVIAPEQIHARDLLGAIDLLVAAVESALAPPGASTTTALLTAVERYRQRLAASGPAFQKL